MCLDFGGRRQRFSQVLPKLAAESSSESRNAVITIAEATLCCRPVPFSTHPENSGPWVSVLKSGMQGHNFCRSRYGSTELQHE